MQDRSSSSGGGGGGGVYVDRPQKVAEL